MVKYANEKRRKINELFFKNKKGDYGEGDKFLGVSGLEVQKLAKEFENLSLADLETSLKSEYNEKRLLVIKILIKKCRRRSLDDRKREEIFNFLWKNLDYINNWNLVDLYAPNILGEFLYRKPKMKRILFKLSNSKSLWQRRIAIVSTKTFVKYGDLSLTLDILERHLNDQEDLIHKALGWILREVWKKDSLLCEEFLRKNYEKIPRTSLRYAIEKMDEEKRKAFLLGKF